MKHHSVGSTANGRGVVSAGCCVTATRWLSATCVLPEGPWHWRLLAERSKREHVPTQPWLAVHSCLSDLGVSGRCSDGSPHKLLCPHQKGLWAILASPRASTH